MDIEREKWSIFEETNYPPGGAAVREKEEYAVITTH